MLKYLTTLAAAITPLMYFHGEVFHDAYLRALGVPPDLFPLSFEGALVQGFMAYMLLSIPALLLLLVYLTAAFGVAYNLNEVGKISFVKKVIGYIENRIKHSNPKNKTAGYQLTEKTFRWVSYALLGVVIMLILLGASLGIAIKIEALGKENATNNIAGVSKNSVLQELRLIKGDLIRGYILECSNYGCAIFSDNKIQIIPIAQIEAIDSLPHEKLTKH